MAKMTDDDIRAYIEARVSKTLSTSDSELRGQREKALDFYYGRPLGNEIEGRAQVVSKDLMDTIEWMMPSLMRVFSMSESVQFDPVGPEDEALAKQETAYVNHVLWKKNPGFTIIHNSIKDGLMQKQGYAHYEWEDTQKVVYDEYEGLTEEQLVMLAESLQQKGEAEPIAQKQAEDGTWHVKFRLKSKYGCAKVEIIPPDDMLVDSECRGDVKLAKLAGHFRRITRSDLIEELGLTKAQAKEVKSYSRSENTGERLARDTVGESTDFSLEDNELDWASQEVELLKCYTRLDVDGDGIAEMRTFLVHGEGVLENKECNEIQYCSFTPSIIPHRHTGLSMYDLMEDLQRIKTALQRGLLDNVYFTMNPRIGYDKNTVDVNTLMINRPGGHIAVDGPPGMALMASPISPMAGQLLPVIDYFDAVKETRTGVGRITSGVDADVLAQSTKGAYVDAKSAANQRIEMIARIYAETFLAPLFSGLHKLLSHHQDWATRFKMRNEWVEVNPSEWQERTDMTVSVGLGNANREEVRNNLIFLGSAQERAAQIPGLVQPQNVFNLFSRIQSELGFEGAAFITDPKSPEYQQYMEMMSQNQGQDPYLEAEAIKAQGRMQEKQIDAQLKVRQQDQDMALGIAKLETDAGLDLAKAGIGAELNGRRTPQARN